MAHNLIKGNGHNVHHRGVLCPELSDSGDSLQVGLLVCLIAGLAESFCS